MAKEALVFTTACSLIRKLSVDTSENKRIKGLLRHGASKRPADDPELFGWLIENLPEELRGKGGKTSYAENALYLALTLYTIGPDDVIDVSIATAAAKAEIKRGRLILVETADDVRMMQTPLRALVKLLKSAKTGFSYGSLAKDIYKWQSDKNKISIIINWERDYAWKGKKDEQ